MKIALSLALIPLVLTLALAIPAIDPKCATCSPTGNCNACKNCSSCAKLLQARWNMQRLPLIFTFWCFLFGIVSAQPDEPTAVVAIRSLTDRAKIATLQGDRACNERFLKVLYWLHHWQARSGNPRELLEKRLEPHPKRQLVIDTFLENLVAGSLA